jgi:hypothetical protein
MKIDGFHTSYKSRAPTEANGHCVGRVKPARISGIPKFDGLHPSCDSPRRTKPIAACRAYEIRRFSSPDGVFHTPYETAPNEPTCHFGSLAERVNQAASRTDPASHWHPMFV